MNRFLDSNIFSNGKEACDLRTLYSTLKSSNIVRVIVSYIVGGVWRVGSGRTCVALVSDSILWIDRPRHILIGHFFTTSLIFSVFPTPPRAREYKLSQ